MGWRWPAGTLGRRRLHALTVSSLLLSCSPELTVTLIIYSEGHSGSWNPWVTNFLLWACLLAQTSGGKIQVSCAQSWWILITAIADHAPLLLRGSRPCLGVWFWAQQARYPLDLLNQNLEFSVTPVILRSRTPASMWHRLDFEACLCLCLPLCVRLSHLTYPEISFCVWQKGKKFLLLGSLKRPSQDIFVQMDSSYFMYLSPLVFPWQPLLYLRIICVCTACRWALQSQDPFLSCFVKWPWCLPQCLQFNGSLNICWITECYRD